MYRKKYNELDGITRDVVARVKEHSDRPEAWQVLFDTLNISRLFATRLRNISSEDSVFTDVELDTLEKLINETTVSIFHVSCFMVDFHATRLFFLAEMGI